MKYKITFYPPSSAEHLGSSGSSRATAIPKSWEVESYRLVAYGGSVCFKHLGKEIVICGVWIIEEL